MTTAHLDKFRRRAVELARLREKSIAQTARDLGISKYGTRPWMCQDYVDDCHKEGLGKDEHGKLVWLCREKQVLEMESERDVLRLFDRIEVRFARLCVRRLQSTLAVG